jgi:chromosome segregation ATPase
LNPRQDEGHTVSETSATEGTRNEGHRWVDGVVDELIQARADTRTSNEDLTHRINGVRERLAERIGQVETRIGQVEQQVRQTRAEVGELRDEHRAFASEVVTLLTDISRRLPPA